jgi:uncharacterized protein YceH (UPF0502 family)
MSDSSEPSGKKWQPLNSRQRRVLGVLVEKAKTTPDVYPMTLNAIVAGCNQKSNREPVMEMSPDDVEQVLEELRAVGAVTEVQGQGRVAKYRHHAYEWLGVEGTESAVMTELLLRGEQTLGDLRARAARMGTIPDQVALKQIVDALLAKGLLIELTPPGRGQIVTHNLYKERELTEIKAQYAGGAGVPPAAKEFKAGETPAPRVTRDMFSELELEVAQLRAEVAKLRERVKHIELATGVSHSELELGSDL